MSLSPFTSNDFVSKDKVVVVVCYCLVCCVRSFSQSLFFSFVKMWYEALPSIVAMGASLSLLELSPFIFNTLSFSCPMLHNSASEVQDQLQRRDARIAEQQHGIRWLAKHMYTYGLDQLEEPVKMSGNFDNYKEAEKKLAQSK